MIHFVVWELGKSIIPPFMSIFSFFILHINFTIIFTKFIVEETWIFIRTTCTASLYILFCCYQRQPPPFIQYILFNSLHYDDMDIITVIYSTIAVIPSSSSTIGFQSIELKPPIPSPPLSSLTITLISLPYSLYLIHLPSPSQQSPPSQPFWSTFISNYSLFSTIGPDFIVIFSTLLRY